MSNDYHTSPGVDLMVDLESLGTSEDSVILSIGAILFDPFSEEPLVKDDQVLCPHFYRVLHVDTQRGRKIDPNTVKWWNSPSREEAKKHLDEYKDKVHLPSALDDLWEFMKGGPDGEKIRKAWACAPSFDVSMLNHAFKDTGIRAIKTKEVGVIGGNPIPFWNDMDVRTIEQFIFGSKYRGVSESRQGVYHNALDDCITQASMVRAAWKVIRPSVESAKEEKSK